MHYFIKHCPAEAPGVAVRNGGAICDASNLIAIVPPGHHTGIFRGVVFEPSVGLPQCFSVSKTAGNMATWQQILK